MKRQAACCPIKETALPGNQQPAAFSTYCVNSATSRSERMVAPGRQTTGNALSLFQRHVFIEQHAVHPMRVDTCLLRSLETLEVVRRRFTACPVAGTGAK